MQCVRLGSLILKRTILGDGLLYIYSRFDNPVRPSVQNLYQPRNIEIGIWLHCRYEARTAFEVRGKTPGHYLWVITGDDRLRQFPE